MKGFLIYTLIVVLSYFSGVLSYNTAHHLLAIPDNNEMDQLYPWVNIFFLFSALPIYFVIVLFFRLFKTRFFVINTLLKTVYLIGISLVIAAMVPYMFGGFGYLASPEFLLSEYAILLYSFFVGAALVFAISSSIVEMYVNNKK
ncbi:hypothetical protein ACFPES_31295 [Paenibacillus sp. GCM10023248]|uniref:hypothetical protein n=1 Tax=unclassified Paenibacillus TaxID=185978 RepID=UPI0023796F7F|nr:hypothetical protein [Paenibacillus sp. MAHUQ-63]MDD9271529.1 hypothetical protein [Paenibacillus sp. MAHUQ-63]